MLSKLIPVVVLVVAGGSVVAACSAASPAATSSGQAADAATPDDRVAPSRGVSCDAQPAPEDATPPSCAAMFDIPLEAMAVEACQRSTDCAVCVQEVGADGVPTKWLAQENASVCPCPKVDAGAPDGGSSIDAAPDAAPDVSCVATFDIGNEAMAKQICAMSNDCAVCVQKVDAQGNAITWLAQENASSCPCPALP